MIKIIKFILNLFRNDEQDMPEGDLDDLLKVKVGYIIDGDTFIVSSSGSNIKIRLDAIDCPEDGQEWGDISKAGLIKMIGGRRFVYLETHGEDIYGRTLATVYVENDSKEIVNVNERMVMLGHAWVMRKYIDHLPRCRQNKLNQLEWWAKRNRVGLWKSNNPIPPWKWRKKD